MGKKIDLTDQRFGRLTVLEEVEKSKVGRICWKCQCDCGSEKIVSSHDLRNSSVKSCSCLQKEYARSRVGVKNPMFGKKNIILSERNKRNSGIKRPDHSKRMSGVNNSNYKHGLAGTKEYSTMLSNKRRATKLNQTPDNANLQKIQLYYSICAYLNSNCEIPMWHVDHIRPISKGGLHHEDNLQILTAEINLQKSAKYPLTEEEEIKYKGTRI